MKSRQIDRETQYKRPQKRDENKKKETEKKARLLLIFAIVETMAAGARGIGAAWIRSTAVDMMATRRYCGCCCCCRCLCRVAAVRVGERNAAVSVGAYVRGLDAGERACRSANLVGRVRIGVRSC